jgi:hypothetical protein
MCKVMHEEQVVLDVSTPPEPELRGATYFCSKGIYPVENPRVQKF